MENIALEYGRQLYKDRYGEQAKFRFLEKQVLPGTIEMVEASNEICVLYDISRDDQAFKVESDTSIINNVDYFKNTVPTRPYDMSGNILINTKLEP